MELVATREVTDDMTAYRDKHCLETSEVYEKYDKIWAWVLENPKLFDEPKAYENKGRLWVRLVKESTEQKKVEPQLKQASHDKFDSAATFEELLAIAGTEGIRVHRGHRLFRYTAMEYGIHEGFKFNDTIDSQRQALRAACCFKTEVDQLEKAAGILGGPELKLFMSKNFLKKSGNLSQLRSRWVHFHASKLGSPDSQPDTWHKNRAGNGDVVSASTRRYIKPVATMTPCVQCFFLLGALLFYIYFLVRQPGTQPDTWHKKGLGMWMWLQLLQEGIKKMYSKPAATMTVCVQCFF